MATINYSSLTSIDNLFQAWEEFKKGKRKKSDVQEFQSETKYGFKEDSQAW